MRFRLAVFSLLLLLPWSIRADDYPPFKLGLSSQIVATGFELEPKLASGTKLKYRPAQANYAGVIAGYRWLSGTVSFAVPAKREIRDVEGTSRYHDYRLSYYLKKLGGELSYSRYLGYLIDNSNDLSAATLAGQSYYKVSDLETLGYGANFIYALGDGPYSLAGAIDQSELQSTSAGAPVLIATWRNQHIQSSSPLIPAEKRPDFGADQNINFANTMSYALGGGYSYNWVPSIFFISFLGALSFGYQHVHFGLGSNEAVYNSSGANIHLRLGLGINTHRFFLTGTLYDDYFGQETSNIKIGNTIYGINFCIGTRF